MKYILLFTLTMVSVSIGYGQINLEKTFEEGEVVVNSNAYYDLDMSYEYLVTYDSKKQILSFYNEDYNLYKSITNIFDGSEISCTVTYLSRGLFNTDDKLEFLAYITSNSGVTVKIINEDGEVLKDFGSVSTAYCIKIKNEIKLLVNSYEISYEPNNPGAKYTSQIYSIPGKLDK